MLPHLERGLDDGGQRRDTSAVHQASDPSKAVQGVRHEAVDLGFDGDVAGNSERITARRTDRAGNGLERVGAPRGEDDCGSLARAGRGDAAADALAGPGDDDHLVV